MDPELFLDTAYAIALSSTTDQYHSQAVQLADQLRKSSSRLITTRAVMLEIGNALSKRRYRQSAIKLLAALEADLTIGIVPLTEEIYSEAFSLYTNRPDKEWGLVDCVSFVVMQERKISSALTTDDHFVQAGFRALLRE